MAERPDHSLCGFIEVGIRSIAEGCFEGNPVGYVEVERAVHFRKSLEG